MYSMLSEEWLKKMIKDQRLIQGTPEWLEFRKTGVFASDTPIIMGVSPWKTVHQLYLEKMGDLESKLNWAMQRGKDLEEEARSSFERLTGHFVSPRVILDKDETWMGASMDGINDEGIAVEIKCGGLESHLIALSGRIPDHYYPQIQHQMYVCKLLEMYYFSYNPTHDEKWAIIKVKRNDDYIKEMLKKIREFYQCLQNKTPPEMTKKEAYKNKEDISIVNDDIDSKLDRLHMLSLCKKDLDKEFDELKEEILSRFEDSDVVMGKKIQLKKVIIEGRVDYKGIPELRGVNLDPYRKQPTISWRLSEIG